MAATLVRRKVCILTPPGFTSFLVVGLHDEEIERELSWGGEITHSWDVYQDEDGTLSKRNEVRH